jgi:NTP pyrophosphatase (non-canonical NTP hydrolase)
MLTFRQLQRENAEWAERNFGARPSDRSPWVVFGIVEEVGELCHALLKQHQGIRGSWDEHEAKAKDAVGDILVYLANTCERHGWDMQEIIEQTWAEVKARDWVENKANGRT